MRYFIHLRHAYHEHIKKKKEEPRFLILTFFTGTFIVARLIVYGIMHNILPKPFGYFVIGGFHIHHIVFGVLLLLIAGFIRIPQFGEKLVRLSSILYGIGAALTLDEFALLVHFNPNAYLGEAGEISLDAVFIFFLLSLGFLWHGKFWSRVITFTFFGKRKHHAP